MNQLRSPDQVDPRYQGLFRIGGVAFMLVGTCYTVCLWLTLIIPASSGDAASYLHATSANLGPVAALWAVYLVSDLLLVPGLIALFLVLRDASRALVLVGTALVAAYIAFDMGITETNWLALASLSQGYAAASPVAQAAYVAAAQYALALVPFVNALSFAVSGAGFLLISVAMLHSAFRRRTAAFGVLTMLVALVAGMSWFVPALSWVILLTLVMFAVWCVAVGTQIRRLGVRITGAPETTDRRPQPLPRPSASPVH
ncbi:MAG: hypothetical protein ACHQZR_05540 [Candidatus Limnocylindrales bacterium]